MEAAVQSLRKGKSVGIDNIPAEPVQVGRLDVITAHDNLQHDLTDRRIANPVDPVRGHHTSQERQLAAVLELPNDQPQQPTKESYAKDLTERIEAASEKIIAEEQAGFRAGRSTTELIFNI